MSDIAIYIFSQVCVTGALLLQGSTFLVFNRRRQLSLNICTNVLYAVSFWLLGGYVAVAMGAVAIARDSVRTMLGYLRERRILKPSVWLDAGLLMLWILLLTVGCFFTADGVMSILPYFSTLIFTVAIWQSNLLIYRCAGVVTNILMIAYNAYLFSIMGVILQTGLLMFALVGVVAYFLHERKSVK